MPVIEGYNFTVDMQDRGMVKTLRTIKSEAQALKNVMRANFTELRNSEGSLAAYSTRLENAQASIQKYDEAIKKLRETNQALEQSVKDGTKNRDVADAAIARNINTIERYKIRMASLSHQMKQDMMISQRLGTGIDTLRKSTEAITTSTKSYTDALREQNQYYRSDRAHIEGMRSARESLKAQLRSEISVTDSLRIHQKELIEEYQRGKISLDQNRIALAKRAKELAENKRLFGANSAAVDVTRSKMSDLNETIEKQESHLAGLSERLGKNSTTLANQAQEASKVASSYRQVDRASRGIRTTRIASAFRAGSQHIQHFNNALKESTANTRKWWSESRGAFAGVGIALGGLAAGAGKAIQSATEVQRRYIEVRNLLETSGEHASEAIRHMNAMQREGIKSSQEYGFAQKDIAEQYEELVKRGYSGTAALGSMNAMLKASRASGDDLADTVRVTSEAVDSFGLRVTKGANATKRMEYNTERVANAIASASDRTSSSFQTTGIALGYVSGSAKTLGWSVEETAAAIGKMSDAGVSGTRAGTGLRQVINSLIRPTKAAKVAFKQAGLSIDDFHTKSGKMKSVDKIFGEINEKTKSMSQTERGAFFKAVFGATGQQAAQILARSAKGMKNNRSELTKLIEEIRHDEKTDYIGRLSRKNMQSAQMQIERLKRTAEAFELSVGAALLPAVNKVGNAIAKWAVSKEGSRSMKEFSTAAGNVANTIAKHTKDIIAFGKGLGQGLKDGYHFVKPIVSGLGKITGLLGKSSKGSQNTAKNLGRMVGIFGTLAVGIKAAKVLFGGIFSISKDTVVSASKLVTWIRGGTTAQRGLNAELARTNQLLKQSVALQKAQYSDKDLGFGGDSNTISDATDAISDIADAKGGKTEKLAKEAEKTGAKAGHFWERGLFGKLRGFNKRFFTKLNPKNWTSAMAQLGDKAGQGFHLHLFKHLKGLGGKIKSAVKPTSWTQTFANLGDRAGERFVRSTNNKFVNSRGKVKFSALFRYGSEAAEKAGSTAGMGWARKFAMHIGNGKNRTRGAVSDLMGALTGTAEDGGLKGAGGFLAKFGSKLAKGATFLGNMWMIASAGIDIVKGIRSHNPDQKMKSLGKGIGAVTGGAIAGVFLGPEAAPIGAAIGSAIGGAMPKAIKWGKKIGGNIASGMQSAIRNIQKGGWNGVAKNWNDFWGGMGDWYDQTFGVDDGKHHKSKSHKKPTVTDRVIQTGVHVKKQDVANVKSMSKALRTYAGSLAKVKSELKKNDPSGELNKVNKFLRSHTKQWTAAAGPIKKIGDAFKYLSKFAASVAKKDAFAAFNHDLPKLDQTLKSHGKSIKKGINDLTKALKGGGGKHSTTLLSRFKSLGKGLGSVTSAFKKLNSHLNKTASDFKSIKKITNQFTGKKNPFKSMASGLDKLRRALRRDTSDIAKYVKKIKNAFEGKKGKNFAQIVRSTAKPLKDMAQDFRSMGKSTPKIAKSVRSMAENIKSLSKGKKGGAITRVAKEFDTLKSHLNKDYKSISSSLKKITSTLSGKKGFVYHAARANSAVQKLRSTFGSLESKTRSFANNLKISANAIKTLSSKKASLDSLSRSIRGVYRTVQNYKFGSQIASQARTAARAMTGRSSFSSRFKSASSSVKSTERSVASTFKSLKVSVVSSFKSMWSQVKSETNDSLDDIVSGINDAVDSINDAIDSMDGAGNHRAKHAHSVHLANGTGPIQTPTLGILNDGNDAPEINNSEGLLHKDGVLEMLAGRNVKRLLLPGDQVIKASEMSKLLGYRHFANGTSNNNVRLVANNDSLVRRAISVANSILREIKVISSYVGKIATAVKSGSGDSKLHDASFSSRARSRSKSGKKQPKYDLSQFSRNGFYGNLKATIEKTLKERSKNQVMLDQSTRRALGFRNAKGVASVKASESLIKRINRLYETRKRANEKVEAENRKKRAESDRRSKKKQELLKKQLELQDEKYNWNRKKAVLRKERVAERKKERREREAERKRRRRTSGLSERRTTSGGYTYTYTSTARRRSSGSASRRRTRASVSVSVRGASAITQLLKKISGTHKFRVYVTQKGAKKVQSIIGSILKQVNSSRSKRSMLVRISQSGYKKVSSYLSSVLKKVNSKKTDRSMLIHISQTGYKNVSGKLSAIIDKVKDLQKGKKNELTVHVKHDGIHETKKALESVASTGKKMWKDLESYSSSGIRKMTSQFNSFSRSYRSGFSNMARAIRSTMSHAWSEMHSDAHRGLDRVIGVLREAVGRINGVVKSFGGKNAVSKPAYLATGTGALGTSQRRAITRPTLAVLNDGHDSPETQNKEVVWTPWNNRFDVVPGQNTKALLMPGQEVLNATESKQLGFTHFATGTGALKHLYELAKKYWHSPIKTGESMFGAVTGLTGTINSLAQGMRHSTEGQGVDWWSQLWKMVQNKVEDGLGPASGLLKAVEELGKNKHYSQGKRMSKFFADCSSLVSRALAKYYHVRWSVPNGWALTVAGLWQHAHRISRSEAKPGDPVFWLPDTHVGVYAGHGKYYSAYGPNDGGPVGMQLVGPGATFGRFDGLNTEGDKSKDVKVKANNALQKKIRGQVGKGFWKTIQKITDKYGDNGMAAAFRLGGDIGQRAKAIARALKQAVPGATRAGLSAVIGSWEFESGGLNPAAVNPNGGASGLGQWLYDRKTALLAYARRHGKSWKDPATQINFAVNADSTNSAILKRILRSSGTPSGLATEFSREWERGGYDAQHASAARDIYRVLHGFANGGLATKASIFGEAGPEMAIPLSTDKLTRSRELVAQVLAVMSQNSDNNNVQGNLQTQATMNNAVLDELLQSVKQLTSIVNQMLITPETVVTNVSIDGRVMARQLDKYTRKDQTNRLYNTRMNRSNF